MERYALLIGVSEYPDGLAPLPSATQDVAAMKRVLKDPKLGDFQNVECLINPNQAMLSQRIERWFRERQSDDLAVLFFSGHGIKDERRKLYFAASDTEKLDGQLIRSTALSADSMHELIKFGTCNQQVIILDCCFSGAFGNTLSAKDDGAVELEEQLGAEGRVVLASTSSVDYSFEEKSSGLSVYTKYLVEGIEKGAADTGGDGWISVDELHQFTSKKVREAAPAMSPTIILIKDEGYRIRLAKSPQDSPETRYRKAVEESVRKGKFSKTARRLLRALQRQYGLSEEATKSIESDVIKPFQEYQNKVNEYKEALIEAIEEESTLSKTTVTDLERYRTHLGLKEEDIYSVESSVSFNLSPPLYQERQDSGDIERDTLCLNGEEIERAIKTKIYGESNDLAGFRKKYLRIRKASVLKLLDSLEKTLRPTSLDNKNDIEQLKKSLESDSFRVLVVGEFKRGKSTLLNAMLGAEVLPAYAIPTTAIINEIKWGDNPHAIIHHLNPKGYEQIPPRDIKIDEIGDYSIIKEGVDSRLQTPYEKVEIFWPREILKNNVALIDSPGLNDHSSRDIITKQHLLNADIVIFVFSCSSLGSLSETQFIDGPLRAAGHEKPFFVCNGMDLLNDKDKEAVKTYARKRLGQKTKQNRIFFVSALSALDGHIDKNVQAVSNSGIMEIKAALEKLVASERNSTKIRRVAIGTQSVARTAKSALSQLPPVNNSLSLQASIQGRLTDIEKELDSVIHEIQALAFDEN